VAVNIKSGLASLVAGVQAYFTANAVTAAVSLGWKQPAQQINQGTGRANRVVFIPSDPGGKGGKLTATQQPGHRMIGDPVEATARALLTWERYVVVSVWAVDGTDPHDEAKQIEAVETLFEWTLRAVHSVAHNDARWGDVAWTTSPVEHVFGRELRAGLTYRHPMFDAPVGVVIPTPQISRG
jgi:hypothetical protein